MNNLEHWLVLNRAPQLGPAGFARLLSVFGSPAAILHAFSQKKNAAPIRLHPSTIDYLGNPDWAAIDYDLKWATQSENYILTLADPDYPALLTQIPGSAPPILFVKGNRKLLQTTQIAMVGSRNPSPGGQQTAFELSSELAKVGLTITSGLALGIDACCHRGALAASGNTIAVLGNGLDQMYPMRHKDLATEIVAKNGAVISEFCIGTKPVKENFPRRNRVISGLAVGTVVVEAAIKSGSLITARYAADQGRDVFAIPGSIYNPNARGCHALIKEGAKLVEAADDIVEEIGFSSVARRMQVDVRQGNLTTDAELKQGQDMVIKALGYEPTSVDALVQRTGLTADVVSSILMEMEIEGFVTSMSGGLFTRQALRGAK